MAFVTAINDRGVTFVAHDVAPVDLVTPRPTFGLSALATTYLEDDEGCRDNDGHALVLHEGSFGVLVKRGDLHHDNSSGSVHTCVKVASPSVLA
jgi:hypothetical protein